MEHDPRVKAKQHYSRLSCGDTCVRQIKLWYSSLYQIRLKRHHVHLFNSDDVSCYFFLFVCHMDFFSYIIFVHYGREEEAEGLLLTRDFILSDAVRLVDQHFFFKQIKQGFEP